MTESEHTGNVYIALKPRDLAKINQVYYVHKENCSEINSGATKRPKLEQIVRRREKLY